MSSVIVGMEGPLTSPSEFAQVFLFESAFFDSSSQATSSSSASRITLENRWDAVLNPNKLLDNLVGGQDMFEYELKSFTGSGKVLVCLHSNQILLDGSKDSLDKFKDTCKRYANKFEFILSISVPSTMVGGDFDTIVEYLVSHVHYGSAKGLLFGALGPFMMNDSVLTKAFVEAHKRTGAPLFVELSPKSHGNDCPLLQLVDLSKTFFVIRDFDTAKYFVDRFEGNGQLNLIVPSTATNAASFKALSPSCSIFVSPGCGQKVDFKKFGGLGFDSPSPIVRGTSTTGALSILAFPWSPPKLNAQQDDDYGKWVCDICGLRAKLSEKENFTKHGYTYCSVACLSSHRNRGFEPLT